MDTPVGPPDDQNARTPRVNIRALLASVPRAALAGLSERVFRCTWRLGVRRTDLKGGGQTMTPTIGATTGHAITPLRLSRRVHPDACARTRILDIGLCRMP